MSTLYDKLSAANAQLDKAQDTFEDIGDALTEQGIIQEPIKATSFANAIRNASIGGTGNYNELSNKPNIDGTDLVGNIAPILTGNGFAKTSDIPTKTSQLTNDSGFLTAHQSLDGYALTSDIPTKTSQLSNDSNFLAYKDDEHTQLEIGHEGTKVDISLTHSAQDSGKIKFTDDSYIDGNHVSLVDKDSYINIGGTQHNAYVNFSKNIVIDGSPEAGKSKIWIDGTQLVVTTPTGTTAGKMLQSVKVTDPETTEQYIDWQAVDPVTKTSQLTNDSNFLTAVPTASATQLGGIKVGQNLTIDDDGTLNAQAGSDSKYVIVEPDSYEDEDGIHYEIQNYAVNVIDADDDTALNMHLPEQPADDEIRDFVIRLNVSSLTPPTVTFIPYGTEEITFESEDDSWAEVETGSNIISFAETQRG